MLRNCLWQGGESVWGRPWKGGGGAWKGFARRDLSGVRGAWRRRSSGFEQRGGGGKPQAPGRGAGPQGSGRVRRPGRTPGFRRGTAVSPPSPLDRTSAPRRPPEVELPTAACPQGQKRLDRSTYRPRADGPRSRRLLGLSPALRPVARPQAPPTRPKPMSGGQGPGAGIRPAASLWKQPITVRDRTTLANRRRGRASGRLWACLFFLCCLGFWVPFPAQSP